MKIISGLRMAAVFLLALSFTVSAAGTNPSGITVAREIARDTSPPIRDIIASMPAPDPGDPGDYVIPNIFLDLDDTYITDSDAPAPPAQRSPTGNPMPLVDIAVDGMRIGLGGGGVPPDTTGDVGPDHYFQWVNTSWVLFDKTTGAMIGSPMPGNAFFQGFGGECETTNRGDPLVLFDDQAGRWIVSQFAFTSTANPPWLQCVAVSTTDDPLGSYHRYAFDYSAFAFNDYGKLGVWTTTDGTQNAYLFSQHEFGAGFNGTSFAVVERDRMLNGESAQFIRFGGFDDAYGAIPFHVEGEYPLAAGTCPMFVHFSFSGPAYRIWKLCVNWDAGTATISDPPLLLDSEPFQIGLSGIPQLDSVQRLDDFGSNTMYVAALRSFGPTGPNEAHGVINHAVDVGDDQAGVRWIRFGLPMGQDGPGERLFLNSFETFVPTLAAQPRIIDQGTYAPDEHSRWMGGINLDKSGNIALGYNVSSETLNPEVRIAGKLLNDPAGLLLDETQCSPTMTGAQTGLFGGRARWGDYATMAVDPDNQCTFWFTTEYYSTTSFGSWNTRICTLEYATCGDPDFLLETIPNVQIPVCGNDAVAQVRVGEINTLGSSVTLSQGAVPGGVSLAFDTNLVAPGDMARVTVSGSAALADGEYAAEVNGAALALNRSTDILFGVSAENPGITTLASPADGATGVAPRPTLTWIPTPGAVEYQVDIALDTAFTQVVDSALVEVTAYTSSVLLDPLTTYFWRVTPFNYCGEGSTSASRSFTTGVPEQCPAGSSPFVVFSDDMQDDSVPWTLDNAVGGSNTMWNKEIPPAGTGLLTRAWWADNSSVTSDQRLVSPSIFLPVDPPLTLAWDTYHQYETDGDVNCWDGGFVEYSLDGTNWIALGNERNISDPYPGQLSSGNPAAGNEAWCRQPGGSVRSVFLIDFLAGQNVQFRFRSASDSNTVGPAPAGWGIDNVRVQSCD